LKPLATKLKTYKFVLDAGTDKNGKIKAYSFQATPGALFYRRSLAKKYFGTDDPKKMQEKLGTIDKYFIAAKVIKDKSNGNTFIVSSSGDLLNPFYANRTTPWVVNNKLVIDPMIYKLWNIAKKLRENGYEAQATQWKEGWFAGMNDSLKDSSGKQKQIFSYFLPTWGISYTLMPNAKTATTDTSGDWAMIPGPLQYNHGGSYMAIPKDAENSKLATEFIKFSTLNEETLTRWAIGYYTNDFLKKIDPTIGTLFQGAGDFVSSSLVVDKISPLFNNTNTSKFVGGQNTYKAFSLIAPTVSLKLMQGTDDTIQKAMLDPLESYVSGKVTLDIGIQKFKNAVKNTVSNVTVQ
ncbi:MAG: hypothetical protein ACRC0V_03310, partial [Fusobacteriaceae bacterium]